MTAWSVQESALTCLLPTSCVVASYTHMPTASLSSAGTYTPIHSHTLCPWWAPVSICLLLHLTHADTHTLMSTVPSGLCSIFTNRQTAPSDLCTHMLSHTHCPICPLLAPEFTASLSSAGSCSPKHIVTLWPVHSPVLVPSDKCTHVSTAPSVPCRQAPAHILSLSLFDLCSHLHTCEHCPLSL